MAFFLPPRPSASVLVRPSPPPIWITQQPGSQSVGFPAGRTRLGGCGGTPKAPGHSGATGVRNDPLTVVSPSHSASLLRHPQSPRGTPRAPPFPARMATPLQSPRHRLRRARAPDRAHGLSRLDGPGLVSRPTPSGVQERFAARSSMSYSSRRCRLLTLRRPRASFPCRFGYYRRRLPRSLSSWSAASSAKAGLRPASPSASLAAPEDLA